ncbi:MAG: hypothetical protein ABIP14_14665, partial [Blastocatellia bacterium]
GKQLLPKEDERLNGLTKNDRSGVSKFTRGIEARSTLDKQKAVVARQSLIARIEQLKADIEAKKLELMELKEQLTEL